MTTKTEDFLRGYELGAEAAIAYLADELDLHEDYQDEIIQACREHIARVTSDIAKVMG